MNGTFTFDIVTKRATDTYGDVKDILIPLLQPLLQTVNLRLRRRLQLILTDYDDDRHKDDNETIPSSKNVLDLTVYVDNEIPEWTPHQEEVLQTMSRYVETLLFVQ